MQFSIPNPFGPPTVIDSNTMAPVRPLSDYEMGSQASPLMSSPSQPSMPSVPSGPNPLDLLAGQASGERQQGYDMLRQAAQNAPVPQSTMPRPGLLGLVTLASLLGNDASRFDRSYDPLGRFTGAFAQARQEANQNAQQQYAPKLQAAQIGAQEHFNAAQQAQQALTQGRLFQHQSDIETQKETAAQNKADATAASRERIAATTAYNGVVKGLLTQFGRVPADQIPVLAAQRDQLINQYYGGKDPGTLTPIFQGQTIKSTADDFHNAYLKAKTDELTTLLPAKQQNILSQIDARNKQAAEGIKNIESQIKTRAGQLKVAQTNATTRQGQLGVSQQRANIAQKSLDQRAKEWAAKPGNNPYQPSKVEIGINKYVATAQANSEAAQAAIDEAKRQGWQNDPSLKPKFEQLQQQKAEADAQIARGQQLIPRYQGRTRADWIAEAQQRIALKNPDGSPVYDPRKVTSVLNDALRHVAVSPLNVDIAVDQARTAGTATGGFISGR